MLRVIAFCVVWFLVGCSNVKSAIIPQKLEESYIQATRKTELIAQNQVQVVLIAKHLNAIDSDKYPHKEGEKFLLDVYQSERNGMGFFENGYHLMLNSGDTPLKIQALKREDLKEFLEFGEHYITHWGEYYYIEFYPQDKRMRKNLQLILTHKEYGENVLKFDFKPLSKESLRKDRR